MRKLLHYCTRSLFIRLALIMIASAVTLTVITYLLFFNFQHDRETSFNRNLVQYAQFLVRELGDPADRAKAETLGNDLMMRISMEGAKNWTAGLQGFRFPEQSLHTWFADDTVEASSLHGYHRLRVHTSAGNTITFDIFPTEAEREALKQYGWLYLGLTCLVLLLAYMAIRYQLRPVRWLTDGAAAVRDGDLTHRVPVKRGGELRELSQTFNEMVNQLESVVQTQHRLLLGVSHELRTPMTRLKLRLEMLGEQDKADAMRDDLREMEGMISILLDGARMRHEALTRKPTRTDLNALMTETIRRYDNRLPGITLQSPNSPISIWVDPEHIRVVLNNLLDNALKYSTPDADPVELSLHGNDTMSTIIVRDHGIGIPEEAIPHLFEPFFRVDESRTRDTGGYGLGLNLCQTIVEAHGGTIHITSNPGQGSTVTIHLPTLPTFMTTK